MVSDREKACGRCGHIWLSHTETPVRCPNCGTYHWQGTPSTNKCVACGHTWFSRSNQTPLRCPKCKTRSWMDQESRMKAESQRGVVSDRSEEVLVRYRAGNGCVRISIEMNIPLSTVIDILRESDVCSGKMPNM